MQCHRTKLVVVSAVVGLCPSASGRGAACCRLLSTFPSLFVPLSFWVSILVVVVVVATTRRSQWKHFFCGVRLIRELELSLRDKMDTFG